MKHTVEDLLTDIKRIPLGVALCQALDNLGVTVEMDDDALNAFTPDRATAGLYDPRVRKIYLRDGLHPAVTLHAFLHEARHALQIDAVCAEMRPVDVFNLNANPRAFAINTRLREIDADIFAVYVMYAHAVEAGSDYFAAMMDADDKDVRCLRRSSLYRRFHAVWKKQGGSHADADVIPALRASAKAWLQSPLHARRYDHLICQQWQDKMSTVFAEVLVKAESPWREKILLHSAQTDKQTRAACEKAATIYAGLLGEAGFPSYLQTMRAETYIAAMLKKQPLSEDVREAKALHGRACRAIQKAAQGQ